MPHYIYKALRKGGDVYQGEAEAVDRFALYRNLRNLGETVVSVEEEGKHSSAGGVISKINLALASVKESEKIILSRNLAAMIEAGLPLSRAISVLERQTRNIKLQQVLRSIDEDVRKGSSLHAGLAKFPDIFSPLFVYMVKAGEESGGLADALRVIGKQLERMYTLKKKVKGALMYPAIIVFAMIVIAILMLIYVVPLLSKTFSEIGTELPKSTQLIISVSDFMAGNALLTLVSVVLISAGAVVLGRTPRGRRTIDYVSLHMPIISPLVKETYSARTARTLSSLLSAGVEVVTALSITRDILQNSYYKESLAEAGEGVERGAPMAEAFARHEHIYPVLVGEMIAVGEETGKVSDLLLQVALFYEEEVEQKTKDMATIIEPFLMIVVGIVVGFFAISMISPIYSLSTGI